MKKIVFNILFLFISLVSFSATRTIANGGGNFNATGTWVEGAVPVAGDAVVATATSGNLTVNVASGGVGLLSFDMTGYTGILTMTSTLTISGTLKLVAGMGTISGTGAIICNTTATLTSGGKVIPALTLGGTSQTYTLGDNFQVGVFSNASSTTSSILAGGKVLSVSGNCTINRAITPSGAGCDIVYNAPVSTTQTINITFAISLANQTINAAGTVSINSYVIAGGTLTYTAGTISGVALLNIVGTCTVNTSGMTWGAVTYTGTSQTYTLTSDLNATGLVTMGSATLPIYNGYQINTSGGLSVTGTGTHAGTTKVVVTGGNVSCLSTPRILRLDLTLDNTNAGSITLGANTYYSTGTIQYIAGTGTFVTTGGVFNIVGTCTLNTSGTTFNNLAFSGTSQTYTLLSQLNVTTLTLAGVTAQTFAGAYNIVVGTITSTTTGCTYNFKDGQTLTIQTALNMNAGTSASHNIFSSSHGTNTTSIVLTQGASQDNSFLDGTRIDSSLGKTICTYKGTLTTTTNWRLLPTDVQTVSY